jgi:polyphosphate kinase
MVAPFTLREGFERLLSEQCASARSGDGGHVILKMNSLEDRGMIDRLYEAAEAGVTIDIIVRGICCLRPGIEGLSDRVRGRSIIDRFLEHARVYVFGGAPDAKIDTDEARMYVASADWMSRNLNRRIEVAFPVLDSHVRTEIAHIVDLQLRDDTKARILDADQSNAFVQPRSDDRVRSQLAAYRYLAAKAEEAGVEVSAAAGPRQGH